MHIILNHSSMVPIYEQLMEQIKSDIINSSLKEGEALPSVRSLAGELRISALTVKKAYDKLEGEGFVTTIHGKGTYVTASDKQLALEARQKEAEADFEKVIDGFRNFRRFYFDAENDYYTSLNKGQHPKAIVIACSDSRADPALLMGCDPGDIFVVRNVANLVPHADDALRRDAVLAVLEYGVHHLKVEHIIVLGHSGCGGIQALLNPESVSYTHLTLPTILLV